MLKFSAAASTAIRATCGPALLAAMLFSSPAYSQDDQNSARGMNGPAGGEAAPQATPDKPDKKTARKHRAHRERNESASAPATPVQSSAPPPAVFIAPGPFGVGITFGR